MTLRTFVLELKTFSNWFLVWIWQMTEWTHWTIIITFSICLEIKLCVIKVHENLKLINSLQTGTYDHLTGPPKVPWMTCAVSDNRRAITLIKIPLVYFTMGMQKQWKVQAPLQCAITHACRPAIVATLLSWHVADVNTLLCCSQGSESENTLLLRKAYEQNYFRGVLAVQWW